MRKFLVFIALSGLLALGGPVSPVGPVGAEGIIVTDSGGDGATHGDANSLQIAHGATSLVLGLVVSSGEDPATTANWTNPESDTRIEWNIDTNGSGAEEFYVIYASDADGIYADVYTAGDVLACTATPTFSTPPSKYEVNIPRSCLGTPASVRISAEIFYDPTPGGASDTTSDRVPDAGFSNAVAADAADSGYPVRVAVVGLNDNQVWSGHGGGGLYEPMGGQTIAAPAVARLVVSDPDAKPVFVVTGTDNQLWIRTPDVPWRLLSDARTHCIGNPAALIYSAVGGGGQQLSVACRGSDNALWKATGPITPTTLPKLNAWTSAGGVLTAGPSIGVSQQPGKAVTYLVVGVGGKVYQHITTGFSPTPWTCKDHVAFGSLDETSWFGCRGSDDGLWAAKNTPAGWGNAFPLGGRLVAGPGVAVTPSAAVFFVQGTDNGVWQTIVQNSDNSRTPFSPNGGRVKFGMSATPL